MPLPLTVPVCPGASVTAIWEELELLKPTVVLPLELAMLKVTEAVPLFSSVKEPGLADNVQAPVVGEGVGVGEGLQFTPLLLQGVGVGSGVDTGVGEGVG